MAVPLHLRVSEPVGAVTSTGVPLLRRALVVRSRRAVDLSAGRQFESAGIEPVDVLATALDIPDDPVDLVAALGPAALPNAIGWAMARSVPLLILPDREVALTRHDLESAQLHARTVARVNIGRRHQHAIRSVTVTPDDPHQTMHIGDQDRRVPSPRLVKGGVRLTLDNPREAGTFDRASAATGDAAHRLFGTLSVLVPPAGAQMEVDGRPQALRAGATVTITVCRAPLGLIALPGRCATGGRR